ncbi:MAG: 50S ribosomal protein L4 [Promethearchaeota archaeon]|jgi:large subunit ribosomal protein L4e
MEKINIYNLEGKKQGLIDKPMIFDIKPRKDIIQNSNSAFQSKNKQAQGRDRDAGLKNISKGWGTGYGMSRAPRRKGSGFPTARHVGRVPFAKGGRRTHPIKAEKQMTKKINKKINKLSIMSAISASGNRSWVSQRSYQLDAIPEIPLVVDDKIQTIKKTARIYSVLCNLGLEGILNNIKKGRKIRSGKGKGRGRKYKHKKGVLLIIKDDFGIVKASRNIPGTDVIKVENISVNKLAPGGVPGRMVVWAQSAFNELNNFEVSI